MNLPMPLSKSEERIMIDRASTGDRSARNTLIEHNLRLVRQVATKYSNVVPDADDRFSIGCFALVKAVNSYNSLLNVNISTYITSCIHKQFITEYKKNNRKKRRVGDIMSLDTYVHDRSTGEPLSMYEAVPSTVDDPLAELLHKEQRGKVAAAVQGLTESQRDIIQSRYMSDPRVKQSELAKKYGMTQAWVSLEEKRGVRACKNSLEKYLA